MDTRRRHRRSSQRWSIIPGSSGQPPRVLPLYVGGVYPRSAARSANMAASTKLHPRHGAPYCFLPTACAAFNRDVRQYAIATFRFARFTFSSC